MQHCQAATGLEPHLRDRFNIDFWINQSLAYVSVPLDSRPHIMLLKCNGENV
jgi:hypothetical protein